jgi:squalene cyclase
MFALESLSLNGETYDTNLSVKNACEFLRSKQKLDGGWGETYMVSILVLNFAGDVLILWTLLSWPNRAVSVVRIRNMLSPK